MVQAQTVEADVHVLRIKVRDGITGEDVNGITISVVSEGGEAVWMSVTSPDGIAEASLPQGEYLVKARMRLFGLLFTIGSFSVEVTESTSAEINVSGIFLPVKYVPAAVYGVVFVVAVAFVYVIGRRVTASPPSLTRRMHVDRIWLSSKSRDSGPGTSVLAIASMTVKDAKGIPVEGAAVHCHWEGATTGSFSVATDRNGHATSVSNQVQNPPPGTAFVFVVDNILLAGWTYDPSENLETRSEMKV